MLVNVQAEGSLNGIPYLRATSQKMVAKEGRKKKGRRKQIAREVGDIGRSRGL